MTALHDRIRAALPAREARWYDGLAPVLAAQEWSQLARSGIEQVSYGAARVLRKDPNAVRLGNLMHRVGLGRPVPLERYDAVMLARYGVIGLREPGSNFDPEYLEAELAHAMLLIDVVPGAGEVCRELVWSITPVDVEGSGYDTGYSDPALPFSIFIGAHAAEDCVPTIRLAESVLHEAMHLQLSLIEDSVPLIVGNGEQRYSPWQRRPRPTQGILHGLYVFRVIQDWLGGLITDPARAKADIEHARIRIMQIEAECSELANVAASDDLTTDGRILAAALTG